MQWYNKTKAFLSKLSAMFGKTSIYENIDSSNKQTRLWLSLISKICIKLKANFKKYFFKRKFNKTTRCSFWSGLCIWENLPEKSTMFSQKVFMKKVFQLNSKYKTKVVVFLILLTKYRNNRKFRFILWIIEFDIIYKKKIVDILSTYANESG